MAVTLSAKINAPELLERQLSRRAKKKDYGIIALSSSTEPYMPIEEKLGLTRKLLEVILKYKFPVHVLTKSTLVLRDLDLLKEIDKNAILPDDLKPKLKHGAIISFSISTIDEKLAKILEPGAPPPKERLKTMKKCKEKGFLTGIDLIPVLPYLSDSEDKLDEIIKTVKNYNADFVLVGSLTLFDKNPNSCKPMYYKVIKTYYPYLLPKYKNLFKLSSIPPKQYRSKLKKRVIMICEKYKMKHRITTQSNSHSKLG